MVKRFLAFACLCLLPLNMALAQEAFIDSNHHVAHGKLLIKKDYPSALGPHTVWVWLPDNYGANAAQRYHVLYMFDGQNLFDPSPYSGADWGVAETLGDMIEKGEVPPTIVVGIESRDQRTREYMPQKVYEATPKAYQKRVIAFSEGPPLSDAFLKFVVTTLKPDIDRRFNTDPSRSSTSIMGSSMGGHMALYAMGEYPEVFGASASVSMPWLMAKSAANDADVSVVTRAWQTWLSHTRLRPDQNRIYSDQGDKDLDVMFAPFEKSVSAMFRAHGFGELRQFQHWTFKDTGHSEIFWRARLKQPLQFLLGAPDNPLKNHNNHE
jgi:enterochelin esterase-like enzyme